MESMRLLLVDDEEQFRNAIVRRLKKRGVVAEQAESGEECLSILKQTHKDVVVMDVKMPGMNGIETLAQIRKNHPETEVILLTGHATTSDGVEGIKAGAFDYLTKPIEVEHLVEKIKQAHEKILRKAEKRKEAQFRAKIERQMITTERLASLGTLASGVAHEINNPLAIIQESVGWMQLILNKEEMVDIPRKQDFKKALNKIECGIKRAKRITHQLLGFVQKQDSVLCETNLSELVAEVVELNIEIVQTIDPDLAKLWSEAYQLRQVLINLLTNAIHATGFGGNIGISLKDAGARVILIIRDTGEGIPTENLKKIFEPFFSTKAPGEGTGLGLFVTRGIIEKLGGKIEVKSKVGHGTEFHIILPKHYKINETVNENRNICSAALKQIKGESNHD
jgi:signal transduction histidine kinase